MQPIYRYFAGEEENLDFSEQSVLEAYLWETRGIGNFRSGIFTGDKYNGYVIGKHWMDVTVGMWLEDFRKRLLHPMELYLEPDLKPFHWWLDKIVKRKEKSRGY
ncbi:MAG: hypothetical protein DWQ19_10005 [Crenarchaeota archaeon]|nr:MAG: hypothetical protein DWQ19_10005 [Thermoproteota archaeon]